MLYSAAVSAAEVSLYLYGTGQTFWVSFRMHFGMFFVFFVFLHDALILLAAFFSTLFALAAATTATYPGLFFPPVHTASMLALTHSRQPNLIA